ncbi:hypothetical protein [Devosia chinhatensis]|uniref:CHAD domain-containing protein n=1 Tax=Devosia chinhatensis TaxID=429727 RepID=A0A0F5FLV0_9HYPH|nr:hypothetical protein [Devosia chinhatensis]KKB09788.1 hypothetical protein VE26_07995 [Devosia chinhatensis]
MHDDCDIDDRLRRSLRILRAWLWMMRLTRDPDEVAMLLRTEARALVALGRKYPSKARQIGRLIVGYHRALEKLKGMFPPPDVKLPA